MDLGSGVYIEEVTPPRSIDGVATSTAAFLGHATDGPLDRAVLVTSLGDYERTFGAVADLRPAHAAHPGDAPDVEWKYVNVRRLAIFLERSIEEGTRWAVFEPNAEPLWGELRRVVDAFLASVWQQGALVGTRPEEAWFVHCGLGGTTTQDDIDNGRVIVLAGIAPLRPAEFVILRFTLAAAGAAA